MNYYPNGGYQNYPPYGKNAKKYPHIIPVQSWLGQKKNISRLGMGAGAGIILYILASNILVMLLRLLPSSIYNPFSDFIDIIFSVFIVGGSFAVMRLIFKSYYNVPLPFGKPKNMKYLPMLIVAGIGLCFAGDVVTTWVSVFLPGFTEAGEYAAEAVGVLPDNALDAVVFVFRTALVPAIMEETVMRGIIMQPLRKYGDAFAIVMSSLVFGLLHCNLVQIPFAFLAGLALGYIAIVTESLWASMLLHFLNNAYAIAGTFVSAKFGVESVEAVIFVCIFFYGIIIAGCICGYCYFKTTDRPRLKTSLIVNSGRDYIDIPGLPSAKVSYKNVVSAYVLNVPFIIAVIAVVYQTVEMFL